MTHMLRHTLRHHSSSWVILRHHWHHCVSTTGLAPLLRIRRPRGVQMIWPVSYILNHALGASFYGSSHLGASLRNRTFFLPLLSTIQVMKSFLATLCCNHAIFTPTIIFFLDTFLWYIIWNTVYSIPRSFMLRLSIWTTWRDIYAWLPKHIYFKILVTSDPKVRYKPKVCFVRHPHTL